MKKQGWLKRRALQVLPLEDDFSNIFLVVVLVDFLVVVPIVEPVISVTVVLARSLELVDLSSESPVTPSGTLALVSVASLSVEAAFELGRFSES